MVILLATLIIATHCCDARLGHCCDARRRWCSPARDRVARGAQVPRRRPHVRADLRAPRPDVTRQRAQHLVALPHDGRRGDAPRPEPAGAAQPDHDDRPRHQAARGDAHERGGGRRRRDASRDLHGLPHPRECRHRHFHPLQDHCHLRVDTEPGHGPVCAQVGGTRRRPRPSDLPSADHSPSSPLARSCHISRGSAMPCLPIASGSS